MKNIFHSLLIITLFSFLFSACKKKDVQLTTAEKVQGTWQLQTDIYHEFINGIDQSDTTIGANMTIEFRNDGKVYSNNQGQKDTTTYTLSGDTQIIIDQDQIYQIKTLTSNSFILYYKETQGADFSEETITLKK